MKKRPFFLLATVAVLNSCCFAALAAANSKDALQTFGEHETHNGNHYAAKVPTVTESGYQEFWVCCKCHETFLTKPLEGIFKDADPNTMVCGLDAEHKAYVPSAEEVAAEAIVKSYTPHLYFLETGTYEFNIFPDTKDLRLNTTVNDAANTMIETVRANANDSEKIQAAYADYRTTLAQEYVKDMIPQTTHVLRTLFGSVNQGVLASTITGGTHINAGEYGDGNESTWVAIDPLNSAWGSSDNRWWIPEAYKASAIIAWAETLATRLTSVEDIETALHGLMIDAARCAGQFIMEVEAYYALQTNATGFLTIEGDKTATMEWNVWTYKGDKYDPESEFSPLVNVSSNTEYDPSKCTKYYLCGALYQPDRADYAKTLEEVINNANWVIAHQVDDMFLPLE